MWVHMHSNALKVLSQTHNTFYRLLVLSVELILQRRKKGKTYDICFSICKKKKKPKKQTTLKNQN